MFIDCCYFSQLANNRPTWPPNLTPKPRKICSKIDRRGLLQNQYQDLIRFSIHFSYFSLILLNFGTPTCPPRYEVSKDPWVPFRALGASWNQDGAQSPPRAYQEGRFSSMFDPIMIDCWPMFGWCWLNVGWFWTSLAWLFANSLACLDYSCAHCCS